MMRRLLLNERAGIDWLPGDEDYPLPSLPGEDAVAYFHRWLAEAPYARIERDGVRYIHETDVANLINAITMDLDLLDRVLSVWGERLLGSDERSLLGRSLQQVLDLTGEALVVIERDRPTERVGSPEGDGSIPSSS
jgi:hypothetical protein